MPPKSKSSKAADAVTSRLYQPSSQKTQSPSASSPSSSPRPVMSRQRRRDQKEFLSSVEKVADQVLHAEQEQLVLASSASPPQSPLSKGTTTPKTKYFRIETPAITLEKPPGDSIREDSNDENDDSNNVKKIQDPNSTDRDMMHQQKNETNEDDETIIVSIPIPVIPESMKHSSAFTSSSLPSTTEQQQKSGSNRRIVTILPAKLKEFEDDYDSNGEQKKDTIKPSKMIPSPPTTSSTKQDKSNTNPRFLQSIGNVKRKKRRGNNKSEKQAKSSSESQERNDENDDQDEDAEGDDQLDDDDDPNNFITVSVPSPWNRGSISKRIRVASRSMNIYASDDFHKTEKGNANLSARYNRLMMTGTAHEEDLQQIDHDHDYYDDMNKNDGNNFTNTRNNNNPSRRISRGGTIRTNENNNKDVSISSLSMSSSKFEDSHIGADDDDDGGNNFGRKRLRGGGPLMIIRRFDGLDDRDNATLLDINMDGNAKCVSARRPISGVTGLLPTATMIAASKTISSFGEQTDGGAFGAQQQQQNQSTRKLLQQKHEARNALHSTETVATARQLLLNGLNPFFGAGAVSDSARENTGAAYALTQLELKQDPFSIRRKKRIEKYYLEAQKFQEQQQQQVMMMMNRGNEAVGGGDQATLPMKNSIGARRRSSTLMMNSAAGNSGGKRFGSNRGNHHHGITDKNAFDTLDTHQAQIHVQLSNLIKNAKEKTQTKNYLVPTAHAVLAEEDLKRKM